MCLDPPTKPICSWHRLRENVLLALLAFSIALADAATSFAGQESSGFNAEIRPIFAKHCVACHGADRRGLPGLGVSLVESAYVRRSSEADLRRFLRKGRMPGEKANVTGRPMPAFEWLGDDTLTELARELKNWSG